KLDARGEEFTTRVLQTHRVIGEHRFSGHGVTTRNRNDETLECSAHLVGRLSFAVLFPSFKEAACAVMSDLHGALAHVENARGLFDRIIHNVSQNEHRARFRAERLESNEKGK